MFKIVVIVLLFAASAAAQQKEKDWNEILIAAKKEGKVVVVGSPDPVMRNGIIPKCTARFGIAVEFIAGRSSEIVSRVQTERSAQIYSVDVFLAGPDTTANELFGDKIIDPQAVAGIAGGRISKWKTEIFGSDPQNSLWFARQRVATLPTTPIRSNRRACSVRPA
jgi:hypothetical protein